MNEDNLIDEAEKAIFSYEKIRDEIDPTLAYSWRQDNKTANILDNAENKLVKIAGTLEKSARVLKDKLRLKKESFQNKMNALWKKVHFLEEKNAGEEIQKYYKNRMETLKKRIKYIKDSEKNIIDGIQLRIKQLEEDRTNIESYLSEIRSKTQ